MDYECNPMWNVCYVKWRNRRNGVPEICYTFARSFRSERIARKLFKEIYIALEEQGFHLSESEAECEGVRGRLYKPDQGRNSSVNVVLYITRNPTVW